MTRAGKEKHADKQHSEFSIQLEQGAKRKIKLSPTRKATKIQGAKGKADCALPA
jgi:hypothetical protein